MKKHHVIAIVAVAALLFAPRHASAQAPGQRGAPHIGYAYPAGGQQGTTFSVRIGGQALEGASAADFSGAGMHARIVDSTRPLTQKEFTALQEEMKALQEKRQNARAGKSVGDAKVVWTPDDEKKVAELRKKLVNRPNRLANPALVETVTLEVMLDADAGPGTRELRLQTPAGLSNPLAFCVGNLPEFRGPPAAAAPPVAAGEPPRATKSEPAMEITLPAIANGQIMPGEVDRFHFNATAGQRLTIAVAARVLIPYLADAVPGWFQATLTLLDDQGREIAYDDDYRFNPDPALTFQIPRDGAYTIEIKDSIFRGREDFVYRIAVGELPFVTNIFPLGGATSAQTLVDVKGWNLPADHFTVDGAKHAPGVLEFNMRRGAMLTEPVPFALDDEPECLEAENGDDVARAQTITLPVTVNGRIDCATDADVFCFEGRAGAEIVAEVFARRLNSPLDSVVTLTDSAGHQLAFNDDHEDKGSGLTTHHADSRLATKLPADGVYFLRVADAQHEGGADHGYRLRVGSPRPDFGLRVVPSSINVRSGASVPVTIYALRKDGFAGEIALALRNAPVGFILSGARVPATQDQIRFTLTAPALAEDTVLPLAIEGRATIDGKSVVREAVPADDMMQAFAYRHLVPAHSLKVGVATARGVLRATPRVLGRTPVKIVAGETTRVSIAAPMNRAGAAVQLELSEPPAGIALVETVRHEQTIELVLSCDAARAAPGLQGNLIVQAFIERGAPANATKQQAQANRRVPTTALPAISFEVVAR